MSSATSCLQHGRTTTSRRLAAMLMLIAACVLCLARAGAAITIVPTFDTTITSDPSAATIESTINSVIGTYDAFFTNAVTVPIKFQETTSGLASSSTWIGTIPYSGFVAQLAAVGTTQNAATALATLPAGTVNPVDNSSSLSVSVANASTLGYSVGATPDGFDGTVSLNTSIMNLTTSGGSASKYSLAAATMHEIDEVLGLGSGLNGTTYSRPEDLFRFSAAGVRSYSTSAASSYFSINNGTTNLVGFNQNSGADYGDWYSSGAHVVRVQDAYGTPGTFPTLSSAEITAMNVIGYNSLSTTLPEPATPLLVTCAMAMLALRDRKKKES